MTPEKLKTARMKRHMSQVALAKLLGVTQATYSSWETGKRRPIGNNKLRVEKFIKLMEG